MLKLERYNSHGKKKKKYMQKFSSRQVYRELHIHLLKKEVKTVAGDISHDRSLVLDHTSF